MVQTNVTVSYSSSLVRRLRVGFTAMFSMFRLSHNIPFKMSVKVGNGLGLITH